MHNWSSFDDLPSQSSSTSRRTPILIPRYELYLSIRFYRKRALLQSIIVSHSVE